MDDDRPLAEWLRAYQAIDAPDAMLKDLPDPAKTRTGIERTVEGNLDGLAFETEAASFVVLLHKLAPSELKDAGDG